MTDCCTQASFTIPCDSTQASIALSALHHIASGLSSYAQAVIAEPASDTLSSEAQIIRHCVLNHPEYDQEAADASLPWSFDAKSSNAGVIISGYDVNTFEAAVFTQAILVAFDLSDMIEISAAQVAVPAETNGFGGHAGVVTKDYIRFHRLSDYLNAERTAHETSLRYFVGTSAETNGDMVYNETFLIRCKLSDDSDQVIERTFKEFREGGEEDQDGNIWFDNSKAEFPSVTEISPAEYSVLTKYISILFDYAESA